MKKLMNTLALTLLLAFGASSQVTKLQVDKMIKESGVDISTTTYRLINYTIAYPENPTSYKTLVEEKCAVNQKSLTVIDAGFEIRNFKEGKLSYIVFIPFSDVIRFSAGEGILTIVLK